MNEQAEQQRLLPPDNVTREELIAALNNQDRYVRSLIAVIDKLITRSPIDSRGACYYCNLYAGQIEVRGAMQYVPRHTEACTYRIALSLFSDEGPTNG